MRLNHPFITALGLNFFLWVVIVLVLSTCYARAETLRLQRVVPPGATLTYAVNGSAVQSVNVPEGLVTVIITFGAAPIKVGHGRGREPR